MRPLLAFLGAALAAAALASPSVAAQGAGVVDVTLTVSVTDPGEDLVPTRPSTLEVRVRFSPGPGAFASEPVSVNLEVVAKPNWTTAVIADPVLTFVVDPTLPGAQEKMTTVNLTLDPKAPAREKADFVIRASSSERGNMQAATHESPRLPLQAKFMGDLNVTAPASLVVKGGRAETVEFVVTNTGNGETGVTLSVVNQPENSIVEGVPSNVTLARGESVVVPVTVRTPWTASVSGSLELEAVSVRAADDATPVVAAVEVQGLSVVTAAPAFAGLLAVAAVAAFLGRRGGD